MDTSLKVSVPLLLSMALCSVMLLCVGLWNKANTQYTMVSTNFFNAQQLQVNEKILHQSYPIIEVENQRIKQGQVFDGKKHARAYDHKDGDLRDQLEYYGNVDTKQKGIYIVRYVVRNRFGLKSVRHIQVVVD